MASSERPALSCPECGADGLIPAHGRARRGGIDGGREHADDCRCRWCDWIWWDDRDPVTCACGARVVVIVDDGHAYAEAIRAR